MRFAPIAAALGTLFAGGTALAQVAWTQLSALAPPGRDNHTLTYDFVRREAVLFGSGQSGIGDDTWVHDGVQWTQHVPAARPPARWAHAATFDWLSSRVVVFGGSTSRSTGGTYFDDLWEWDGANWSQRPATIRPAARLGHALVFAVVNGAVLLFGGRDDNVRFGDTWLWNGIVWTQLAPATSPRPRCCHAMAFHLAAGDAVLFGGWDNVDLGDTWLWNGVTWRPGPAGGPAPRWGHKMTYDWIRERTVSHGGWRGGALLDTWEWDGNAWRQRQPPNAPPMAAHDLAYRVPSFDSIAVGGFSGNTGTWAYGGTALPATTQLGTACAGPTGLPLLSTAALPWLGETLTLVAQGGTSAGTCLFALGLSRLQHGPFALPLDLAPFGMPGCALLTSIDHVEFRPLVQQSATVALAIPASPALTGAELFAQAFVPDPGANAAGMLASNGLAARLGGR